MKIFLNLSLFIMLMFLSLGLTQQNEWITQYVTFDESGNGTGNRTASVAVVGPDQFVALVTRGGTLFDPTTNYLVGYWNADSASGRVPSPIAGQQMEPPYGETNIFTDWEYVLDKVTLKGAWQMAGGANGYVYVANNDAAHNILVFQLTQSGVVATQYRMETGSENIFGIDVDDSGYVYVVDYEGSDSKTNEVKVFAGINAAGTTWGDFPGHNDSPVATIDLPPGIYQGITVSGDGKNIYISASSQRSIWKYTGDPQSGYTMDANFNFTLAPDDTVSNGGHGTPTVLGLAYLNDPGMVCAAVDTFLSSGVTNGYPYGRIYLIDPGTGAPLDTIDIADWNFAITGSYDTGSNFGRAGGFASVYDVDTEPTEKALYTQTYYGWAVEKWVFNGDLNVLGIERVSSRVPTGFQLRQNYPNPFNPVTTIAFDLAKNSLVTLEVYNIMGQKVATLIHQQMAPGSYQITFDARQLPSGVYFYHLKADNFSATRKMILSR